MTGARSDVYGPHGAPRFRMRPPGGGAPLGRRDQAAVAAVAVVLVGFWVATAVHVNGGALNLIFTVLVMAVLPIGVLALIKAPASLQRWVAISLCALFLQIIANAIWYVDYLRDQPRAPAPGAWTLILYAGDIVAAIAAWIGVREILRARDALLDYSIVAAAAASIAAAIIGHQLGHPWTSLLISNVINAILCLLIVVIIGSAALGRWQALPIPVGLMGLALLFDVAGYLLRSYTFTEGAQPDNRWPTAFWMTAAIVQLLAALALIAGQHQPIRLARKPLPGISPITLLVPAGGALAIAVGVTVLGIADHDNIAHYTGLGALTWIAAASLARASVGLVETRRAYTELDSAHLDLEHAHDRAAELVTELEQRNAQLAAAQAMYRPLIELANERTEGDLRARLEDAGDDLADWLLGHENADEDEDVDSD